MVTYYQISITVTPLHSFELYQRTMNVFERETAIEFGRNIFDCVDVDRVIITNEITGEVILDYASDGKRYIAGE